MQFPTLSDATCLERLDPPSGRIRMVLDTDTYNEVDDQFALAYALLSQERLDVEAVYAAPFFNKRSDGPGDGMEKSYEEILRILSRMNVSPEGFAFRGSTDYLQEADRAQESESARDLVERAMRGDDRPLYVVAIGAITNVASSILMEPGIIERIVVVWLGGQPLYSPSAKEFNLGQDLYASQLVFNCGVPLILLPCRGVTSHLLTTLSELEAHIGGKNEIGDYLVETFKGYHSDHFAYAKEIWDISAIAYLINSGWMETEIVHAPILTDQVTWSFDNHRHLMRVATFMRRNPIFRDLFTRLGSFGLEAARN